MLLKNFLRVFALLLLTVGMSQTLNAQRDWLFLGDKHVDGHSDHDKINMGKSEGTFRQLKIRVRYAPVVFQRVVVHFGNGADEELEFRDRINAGGETRPLDLRGTDRIIKSVEFWYEKAHWRERTPQVELYGRK